MVKFVKFLSLFCLKYFIIYQLEYQIIITEYTEFQILTSSPLFIVTLSEGPPFIKWRPYFPNKLTIFCFLFIVDANIFCSMKFRKNVKIVRKSQKKNIFISLWEP